MCTYPIFFFTTDATTDTSDIKESIDSTESKKWNKRTFLYLLTSLKCRYDITEPDQRKLSYIIDQVNIEQQINKYKFTSRTVQIS